MKKTLIPNDLRDFLSIISLLGFVAMFFKFSFGTTLLSELMDTLFFTIAGFGLMVIGKVFSIHNWARDGIQKNEVTQLLTGFVGLISIIIGLLLLFEVLLLPSILGIAGFIALFSAIFIFYDYIIKNTKK